MVINLNTVTSDFESTNQAIFVLYMLVCLFLLLSDRGKSE